MTSKASKTVTTESGPAGDQRVSTTLKFEDEALVEKCRKGDMQAFGFLVAKYQDRLVNMMYRMTGRWAQAEELAQEAFLKALERIGQFRNQSGFYTWLFRIGANLALSYRRRCGRIRFTPLDGDGLDGTQAHALGNRLAQHREPSPDVGIESSEQSRRVHEALERLDDEHRLMIILRDMEEMDYSRIARVLDVPVGTVKSRLHRARCMMKDMLKTPQGDHE